MTAEVLSVVSGKGGVGKTSLATNLAYNLSRMGKYTLVVDLDTTPGATLNLGMTDADRGYDRGRGLTDALMHGDAPEPHMRSDFLYVLPGGVSLKAMKDMADVWRSDGLEVAQVLRERVLRPLASSFDYVIIDTPPGGAGVTTALAAGASNCIITPTREDNISIQGIPDAVRDCMSVATVNKNLAFLGAVLFGVSRKSTVENEETKQIIRQVLGSHGRLFDTVIYDSPKAVRRSRNEGMAVLEYDELVVPNARPWYDDPSRSRRRIATNAGTLAKDWLHLTGEILSAIDVAASDRLVAAGRDATAAAAGGGA